MGDGEMSFGGGILVFCYFNLRKSDFTDLNLIES